MSWPLVALGDIFEIARGGSPRPIDAFITDDSDGVNWISIRDASNSSKYITKTEKKILPSGVSKSRLVKPGDFLLTNSMSFGRPYILQTSGCIHDGWLVLSGDQKIIDQDYFYHLLGSDLIYRKFVSIAAGAVVKNLNSDLVRNVMVPLPTLAEQRRIAAILDKAEALRAKRREAIAKLDQLLKSVFLEMFGDPVTNSKGWQGDTTLGDIALDMQYGPRFHNEAYSLNGIKIVRITDLSPTGELDFDAMPRMDVEEKVRVRFVLQPGNIIFARTGATVGKVALIQASDPPSIAGAYFIRVQVNNSVLPEYVFAALQTKSIQKFIAVKSRQAAQQNFSGPGLRKLPMTVPPLELQRQFASLAKKIEQQKRTLQEHVQQQDALFASLQDRAFNGEL